MTEESEKQNQTMTEPVEDKAEEAGTPESESLLAQKDEEILLANTRITELERALSESQEKLAETSTTLSQAIESYRTLAINSEPIVPAEMIKGDSIQTINASLKSARDVIGRVKASLETQGKATRVPAGAPQRRPLERSAMSPRDKIQYAIGGNK